jgi:hypothetical protein
MYMPADVEEQAAKKRAFLAELKTKPIAEETKAANEQHYEVPPALLPRQQRPLLPTALLAAGAHGVL